jgi:hypothetical protein
MQLQFFISNWAVAVPMLLLTLYFTLKHSKTEAKAKKEKENAGELKTEKNAKKKKEKSLQDDGVLPLSVLGYDYPDMVEKAYTWERKKLFYFVISKDQMDIMNAWHEDRIPAIEANDRKRKEFYDNFNKEQKAIVEKAKRVGKSAIELGLRKYVPQFEGVRGVETDTTGVFVEFRKDMKNGWRLFHMQVNLGPVEGPYDESSSSNPNLSSDENKGAMKWRIKPRETYYEGGLCGIGEQAIYLTVSHQEVRNEIESDNLSIVRFRTSYPYLKKPRGGKGRSILPMYCSDIELQFGEKDNYPSFFHTMGDYN